MGIFSLDHRTCQGGENTLKPLIHYLPRFGRGTEGQLGRQMKQTPLFSDGKARPRAGGAFSGVPGRSLVRRL